MTKVNRLKIQGTSHKKIIFKRLTNMKLKHVTRIERMGNLQPKPGFFILSECGFYLIFCDWIIKDRYINVRFDFQIFIVLSLIVAFI